MRRSRSGATRACLLIVDGGAGAHDRCGEEYAAEEAQCVFVVAGGDSAPLLEPAEAAFNGVALLVNFGVERWWAAACRAFGLAVGNLVVALGNGVADPAPAQRGTGGGIASTPCRPAAARRAASRGWSLRRNSRRPAATVPGCRAPAQGSATSRPGKSRCRSAHGSSSSTRPENGPARGRRARPPRDSCNSTQPLCRARRAHRPHAGVPAMFWVPFGMSGLACRHCSSPAAHGGTLPVS